jgi:CRP-like cAMP-binding protein
MVSRALDFGERLRASIRQRSPFVPTLNITKGKDIYICGDQDDSVYFIESGQIKTIALSPDAKLCLLAIYTDGDLFGELCLTGGRRAETATAMTDSVLKKINCDNFLRRLTEDALLENYIKYLVQRLAEQQDLISTLVTADSEHRLAATLLQLAKKLGKKAPGNLSIDKKISQQELSDMVGTTRSRIGHFLHKFRDLGLIVSAPKAFLIVNEANLTAYLEEDIHGHKGQRKKTLRSAHF